MKTELIKIDKLSLDPQNARKHDKKNLKALEGSLRLFGQRKPIVVTSNNVVVAGNGTIEAAKSLGWDEIAIVRTPEDWSAEQIKAYALADNRTAELAEWDIEVLKDQLLEIDAFGWEVVDFGFEALTPPTDPDFSPTEEEQPRLDEFKPSVCPKCSFKWITDSKGNIEEV